MMQQLRDSCPTLEGLPRELLLEIAGYLEFLEDIASLSSANKAFYTLFDLILYQEDAKPYHRHSIYWAAEHASVAVAQKALDAGTPVNDQSRQSRSFEQMVGKLFYATWPEFYQGAMGGVAPKQFNIHHSCPLDMVRLVELLLQAGADMSIVDYDSIDDKTCNFFSTPLGCAMQATRGPFFQVVHDCHAEVSQNENGCFSALTRAKLAITSGHLSLLEEALAAYPNEELSADLCLSGADGGRELLHGELLHRLAYEDNRLDMCRRLYFWTHGKEADANYLYDDAGVYRRYMMHCAQEAIEAGGSCADVKSGPEWAEFRSIRRLAWTFHQSPAGDGEARRDRSLQDIAIYVRDRQLLELAMSVQGQDNNAPIGPAIDLLRLLQYACSWEDVAWAESIMTDPGLDLTSAEGANALQESIREAIVKGQVDVLRLLLDRVGPSTTDQLPTPRRRSLIAEAVMNCANKTSLMPILGLLFASGADVNRVLADLEAWYPDDTPMYEIETGIHNLCKPGCLELLEQHGILAYRPHIVYLLMACRQHNHDLLQRLLKDGVLSSDSGEHHDSTVGAPLPQTGRSLGLDEQAGRSIGFDEQEGKQMLRTSAYAFCSHFDSSPPYTSEHATEDVKILQAFLTHGGIDLNVRHSHHTVLEKACIAMAGRPAYVPTISWLIENGADFGVMERDLGITIRHKTDAATVSQQLLDAACGVYAGVKFPLAMLETMCRYCKPAVHKSIAKYAAHDADMFKDTAVVQAAMINAAKSNSVSALKALLPHTKGILPAGIIAMTPDRHKNKRAVEYLKAIGAT